MALPATIYRVNLQLADLDRGIYESLQATVARHPSETAERLVARLLAYAIFYEPGLSFTRGISAGDEPDAWVKGPDDRVILWVEVGLPEAERLIRAQRHASRVALVACGRSLPSWEQQHLPKVAELPRITIIAVPLPALDSLTSLLERVVTWSVTITEGALYLDAGGVTVEATLRVLAGSR
jgi:uncharacterized protein YaeQ